MHISREKGKEEGDVQCFCGLHSDLVFYLCLDKIYEVVFFLLCFILLYQGHRVVLIDVGVL